MNIIELTEEELQPTDEERIRFHARMALDMKNLIGMGMPRDQAIMIVNLRHNLDAKLNAIPLDVQGVRTTCVVLEVGEHHGVIFAMLSNAHTVTTMDGTDVFKTLAIGENGTIDKKKLN